MKKILPPSKSAMHKTVVADLKICFSFEHFDASDTEMCPPIFKPHYTQTLMERLKALSTATLKEFMNSRNKSTRAHPLEWNETARPQGFLHLNEHLRATSAWQFQLSANEHGRVHGFFIGHIFYIVWLDQNHRLYPKN
jgi:hypothetical protein